MQENNEQKRLYYLRRYNRLYKDQIYLLEEQIEELKQTENELRQENQYLKNEVYSTKNHVTEREDGSNVLQKEILIIKKYLEEINDTQKVLIHTDEIRRNVQQEHLIGALHRPYKESTYSNGLGKELIIEMNEDNYKKRSLNQSTNETNSIEDLHLNEKSLVEITKMLEEQSKVVMNSHEEKVANNSPLEELRKQVTALQEQLNTFEQREKLVAKEETVGEEAEEETEAEVEDDGSQERKRTSAIVQQIKNYGRKKKQSVEQVQQSEAYEQKERKQRLRFSNLTFRDIQRANQIYSKPNRTMGRTRSSVNRHMDHNFTSKNLEQEESNPKKLSQNHKKPEIVQQRAEEIKAEEQGNEKKRPENVGLNQGKEADKSDAKIIPNKEQIDTLEDTETSSEKTSNQTNETAQVADHPQEEQTSAENQTLNKRSILKEEKDNQPSDEVVSPPNQHVQMNEESTIPPTPSSDHPTPLAMNQSHALAQRTIQPRHSGKSSFVENKHQPSFFKSLLNKLK